MGVTDIICEYIYESFKKIKAALEKIEKTMKDKINSLLKMVKAVNVVIKKTIGPMVDKLNEAIESIRSSIKPLILDIPGKLPYICDDLWKCLALLKELLDDTSALYKSLKNTGKERCLSQDEKNILDNMSDMITDYTKFRDIVCNLGFNFDFCIGAMKLSLKTFKVTGINFRKMLDKKFKFFNGQINTIVRYSINIGLGKYLDSLINFFECAFGVDFPDLNFSLSGEIDLNPCAEIQTAQNFFNEVLATCHLIQEGDGYVIDPQFKAYITSTVEAMLNEVQAFLDNIDKLNEICVNSTELRVATQSYENSKNVWPGDVSWSDMKKAYNTVKSGNWRKVNIVKYFSTKYEDVVSAFIEKKAKSKVVDDCIPPDTPSKLTKKNLSDFGNIGDLLNVNVSTNLKTSSIEEVSDAVGLKANLNSKTNIGNVATLKTGAAVEPTNLDEALEFAPKAVRQSSSNTTDYNLAQVKETNENMLKAKLSIGVAQKGVKTVDVDKYAELPQPKAKKTNINPDTGVPYDFMKFNKGEIMGGPKGLINKPGTGAVIEHEHKPGPPTKSLNGLNKRLGTTRYNKHFIMKNMKIDDDGTVTIQDGCCSVTLDNLPPLSNPIVYEMMAGDISNNSCILDPATDEIISVTEAAVKIACDPTSDLAVRCKEIWGTINNLYQEQNIVQKY